MSKEKEYLLTLFDTKRVCLTVKAKSLAKAKEKFKKEFLNRAVDAIRTINVFEGNVYYHEAPISCEEYIDKECTPLNIKWDEGEKKLGVEAFPFGNCRCGFLVYEGMAYCPNCGRELRWDLVKKEKICRL